MNESRRIVQQCWTMIPLFFILILALNILNGLYHDNLPVWFAHEHQETVFYKWGPFLAVLFLVSVVISLTDAKAVRLGALVVSGGWTFMLLVAPVVEYAQGIIPDFTLMIMVVHDAIGVIATYHAFKWWRAP